MSKDNISIGRIAGRIRNVRGEKMLLCTRCRRTQTKDARMAKKREKARAR